MNPFQHVNAPDIQTAAAWLQVPGTAAIAGGTDLITELKKRIRTPQKLVNLKTIPQIRPIEFESGHLKFGALTTIDAGLFNADPHLVDEPRYRIFFHAELRDPPRMDNVAGGQQQANFCVRRNDH